MPIFDLSLVTQTLMSLLDKFFTTLPAAEQAKISPWNISPLPADALTGDRTLGIYLYHSVEDPFFKNLPPPGQDFPPVQYSPMGLQLFYQLTAHSELAQAVGPQMEQILMGYAMKGLHDFPQIDRNTQMGGTPVFPVDLQGTDNRFVIDLIPVTSDQAVSYWTAGSRAMRFAAYYKVSVVLLQPQPSVSLAGRVLMYGVFTFVRGSPRLDTSSNTITFTPPGQATPVTLTAQPAEVPVGGTITLFGSDLSGDVTTLLIGNSRFTEPAEVDPADWGVMATDSQITAVVQANAGLLSILPGIYSAVAKVTTRRLMPDKTLRDFSQTSNAAPFSVAPSIQLPIPPPTFAGVVTVTGGVFQDPAIPLEAVQVFVGATRLQRRGIPPLAPGQFETLSATQLRFQYPVPGINPGDTVPLRILVNGAESAPNWVTAP
jgi:hypothetical protein